MISYMTNSLEVLFLLVNKNSNFITFSPKEITFDEIRKLCIPKDLEKIADSITKVNRKYYYYKKVDFYQLINELIGSYFSKQIKLDAVDYQIGIYNGEIYALSEIFFNPNYEYHDCQNHFGTIANHKLTESESLISRIYLKEDTMLELIDNPIMLLNILKLTFIDLKMGQIDRNNLGNIMIKTSKSNGVVNLAPVIDFESSYVDNPPYPEFYFYDNPFIVLRKNRLSISSLIGKHPQILDTVNILSTLKIRDTLYQIQDEKRIILSEKEVRYYEEKDNDYSRILQKIVKY